MVARFFCPASLVKLMPDAAIRLPQEVAHHAERVLRLSVGDPIVIFDGEGGEYPARISALGRNPEARLDAWQDTERESPLPVTLVQCLASGDKMDWVLQKAVELGAAAIIPVASRRSVVKLAGERAEKRVEHWRQVVVSACEQCGRNRLPAVASLRPLPEHLAGPTEPGTLRLILAPEGGRCLTDLERPARVELLVGPEGGFTEEERLAAETAGYQALALGPRILRTETAGLAAMAAIQALWGDMS